MPKSQHPDSFASRLRELRTAAALTAAELATRAGISRQYLYLLESGQRQPTLEVARRLAAALGQQLACWQ